MPNSLGFNLKAMGIHWWIVSRELTCSVLSFRWIAKALMILVGERLDTGREVIQLLHYFMFKKITAWTKTSNKDAVKKSDLGNAQEVRLVPFYDCKWKMKKRILLKMIPIYFFPWVTWWFWKEERRNMFLGKVE